jgi:hypothetical protein
MPAFAGMTEVAMTQRALPLILLLIAVVALIIWLR